MSSIEIYYKKKIVFLLFRFSLHILYFGHWRDGSAGTLREEREQVFYTFSSYSNSTKTI
jgi:hypothetical protein